MVENYGREVRGGILCDEPGKLKPSYVGMIESISPAATISY